MRQMLFGLLLLGLNSPAFGQQPPDQPKEVTQGKVAVALNTGAHTTTILALRFTPDGQRLITCQNDEVRVWSVAGGELQRTWRLPTQVDHLAVSADGKLVAAARWIGGDRPWNGIWLLNLETGGARMIRDVPSGAYECLGLAFSPDNERLAWGTWYHAGVYDLKAHRHSHVTARLPRPIEYVTFGPDSKQLLATTMHGPYEVYDLPAVEGKKLPLEIKPKLSLQNIGNADFPVAWAPDGSRFAAYDRDSYHAEIYLWTADGKRETTADGKKPRLIDLKDFNLPYTNAHLQFLDPDRLIMAGSDGGKVHAGLLNLKTGKLERDFQMGYPERHPVHFACTTDGHYLAVTSGPGFQATIYDLEAKKWYRRLGREYRRPVVLGWSDDSRSVAWGLDGITKTGDPLAKQLVAGLNLDTLDPLRQDPASNPFKGFKDWHFAWQSVKGWSNKHEQPNERKDKKRGITLIHDGKRVETDFDSPLRNWQFYKDANGKLRVILCAYWGDGNFVIYDPETGKPVSGVLGWGQVEELLVSPDARFLLVSTGDQVLKLYRLQGKPEHVLSILVAGQDWVVWTPQGYYAATPGGEKLVGWSFKKDNFTPLEFYPLERYRKVLYRPDVIKLVLEKGDVGAALKEANARAKIKERAVDVEQLLPPKVEVKVTEEKGGKVKVHASASAAVASQPVVALRLLLDGRPLPGDAKEIPAGGSAAADWEVELPPGKHELKALARSPDLAGVSAAVAVNTPLPAADKPLLYRVCVGVNDYDQKALALGSARQDAEAVFDALEKDCTGQDNRFRAAAGIKLLDKAATRQAVLDAFKEARKAVKPGDLVIVFFGGHGVVQGGDFFLLTREADTGKPLAGQSLSGADLRAAFGELPCSVLLLMDACHSAAGIQAFKPATDDLTRSLTDDQVAVTVLAAAMGYETAGEHPGHGLFTQALLEGLKAGAGVPFDPHDHELYVHHLYSYVFSEVRRASEGRQNPFLNMPWTVPPLALREVPEKTFAPK